MSSVPRQERFFDADSLSGVINDSEEAFFKDVNYVQLLLRHRWWLVVGGVLGVGLGIAAYLRAGAEYEATAQVLVSRKDSVPIREEHRTLSDWGERSEHIALILSPLMINRAVEIGHLKNLPTLRGSDDPSQDILDDLKAKRSSGQDRSYTNVLTVTYPSRSRDDARAVVEAVIAAYGEYLDKTRNEKSDEVLSLAQQALRDVEAKLEQKEKEYHEFRETAPLQWKAPVGASAADGQTTTNVHQERVFAAEEQRRLNLLRKATLQSRLQAIEGALAEKSPRDGLEALIRRFASQDGPSNDFQSQQQQDLSIFENRLLPLILEEKELLRDYGPDHPDVKLKRQTIATALDFYRRQGVRLPEERKSEGATGEIDFVALYAASLREELKELDLRDVQLAALVDDEATKAKGVARFQARDEAIRAELQQLRDLWGRLVTQVNQVGIEREGNGYVMKQIAPVREELSLKRIMKFVGGGGVAGLILVAGLCLLRELRDLRLKSVSELLHELPLPLVGTIERFSRTVDPKGPGRTLHAALRYLIAPRSPEAESYRSLRAALNANENGATVRTMIVTSPEPGDGKTTTAANLAIALAQSGKRVLLLDGDMRRPTLHQLFRVPLEPGLADALQGEIEAINAVRETFVDNLRIMTAGMVPSNPAELLARGMLAKILKQLRDEFDLILIDSPPLLAVSDPCVLAGAADGVLLVNRLGKTSVNVARRARGLISRHDLKVLGIVANNVDPADHGVYASGGDYYRDEDEPEDLVPERARELAGV